MEHLWYLISLHAFLLASLLYGAYLLWPREGLLPAARLVSLAGLTVHTVPLLRAHIAGTWDLGWDGPFYGLLAWSLVALYQIAGVRSHVSVLGVVTNPLAVIFTAFAIVTSDGAAAGPARTPLVTFHIVVSTWGQALFGIAAAAGILYLYQDWRLRTKHVHGKIRLPDLATLDALGRRFVIWGFVLLSIGLVAGVAVAFMVDQVEKLADPISLAFNGTWVLYLILLLARTAGRMSARKAAAMSTACFALAVMALVSANLIGLHGAAAPVRG